MIYKIPIWNLSSDTIDVLIEPEGMCFVLEIESKMIIEISEGGSSFDLVFKDGFVQVYPGFKYRVIIDNVCVHEF